MNAIIPSNTKAERALIGAVLASNDAVWECGALTAADFSEAANGAIWTILKDQIVAGRTVTASLLIFDTQDLPVWEDVKASAYLAKLEDEAPPAKMVPELARTVAVAALRRRIISVADEIKRRAADDSVSVPASEIRDELERALSSLFPTTADLGLRQVAGVGDRILGRIKNAGDRAIGYDPGLAAFQELMGALQPGRLYFIAGPPASGKSSLVDLVLRNIARAGGVSALYTPEMDDDEVVERHLAADTGIKASRIEAALVNNSEFESLWNANELERGVQYYIDRTARPSMAMIRGRSLRKKRMGGLDVIGVDSVHLMARPDRKMGEFDSLDDNCIGLKALAKDLEIPVLAVCQLGTEALREMSKWPHRRPNKGDLLGAGIIDRNADGILLVNRRETFLKQNEPLQTDKNHGDWAAACLETEGVAELILGKRRGGIGYGRRTIGFDGERTLFLDRPPSRVDPTRLV